MERRAFIRLCGVLAGLPILLGAQKSPVRIGLLGSGAAQSAASIAQLARLKQALAEIGLVEDRDYVLEARYASGNYARFPDLARELQELGAGIIMANTISSVRAAQALDPPVAVVMLSINDPVKAGLIASLARSGNFTTGTASLGEDLTPKLLEFQRLVIPSATRIAALFNPLNSTNPRFVDNLSAQAAPLGIQVIPFALKSPNELEATLSAIGAQTPDALQVISDSGTLDLSDRIASFAVAKKIPSFATSTTYAELGGLLAYGASRDQLIESSAFYVKKIMQGAKPGDLPVEQPTRISLWLNMKTAKALAIEFPSQLQALADKIIE